MPIAKKLKKLSRKVVTLSQIDEETGEPFTLVIRKVAAKEALAKAGAPLSLMSLAALDEGESEEERNDRIRQMMTDDSDAMQDAMDYNNRVVDVVVCAGVVSEKVVVDKRHDELLDDEMRPSDFGADLGLVYNEILAFSGLPFTRMEIEGMRRFRSVGLARDSEQDGEALRDDALEAGEPNRG